eukprot:g78652.t1
MLEQLRPVEAHPCSWKKSPPLRPRCLSRSILFLLFGVGRHIVCFSRRLSCSSQLSLLESGKSQTMRLPTDPARPKLPMLATCHFPSSNHKAGKDSDDRAEERRLSVSRLLSHLSTRLACTPPPVLPPKPGERTANKERNTLPDQVTIYEVGPTAVDRPTGWATGWTTDRWLPDCCPQSHPITPPESIVLWVS